MTLDKERLRELAEAATPGPWILLPTEDSSPYLRIRGTRLGTRYKVANVLAPTYFMPRDGIESAANAEFIAAAREAVPALLSENAALEQREKQALQAASVEAKLFDEERQKNAALAAEVERLEREARSWQKEAEINEECIERQCKDAARYRWLRDAKRKADDPDADDRYVVGSLSRICRITNAEGHGESVEEEELDDAIDAAMAGKGAPT